MHPWKVATNASSNTWFVLIPCARALLAPPTAALYKGDLGAIPCLSPSTKAGAG
jgi:hypothetical protein